MTTAHNGFTSKLMADSAALVWNRIKSHPEVPDFETDFLEKAADQVIDLVSRALNQCENQPIPVEFSMKRLLQQIQKTLAPEIPMENELAWECLVRHLVNLAGSFRNDEKAIKTCEDKAAEWMKMGVVVSM